MGIFLPSEADFLAFKNNNLIDLGKNQANWKIHNVVGRGLYHRDVTDSTLKATVFEDLDGVEE